MHTIKDRANHVFQQRVVVLRRKRKVNHSIDPLPYFNKKNSAEENDDSKVPSPLEVISSCLSLTEKEKSVMSKRIQRREGKGRRERREWKGREGK